ncbi:MAG: response regulator transcription factor [Anaerolineales bacterium]
MSKISVLLVDDHSVVRLGMMTLINDQPGMETVGEAGTAPEAVKAVEELNPDVVLMDIRLPGESGITATGEITQRFPDTKVVMLTSYADDELIFRAVRAGAKGYVLKQVGNEELLNAIKAAAVGEAILDSKTTNKILARLRQLEEEAERSVFKELSARELDVLAEVAQGKTNKEIGDALNLSETTVRNYVSNILDKLNLKNRVELATFAVKHHLDDYLRPQS